MKKQKSAKVNFTSVKIYKSREEADTDSAVVNDILKGLTAASIIKYDKEPQNIVYLHWNGGTNKITRIMTDRSHNSGYFIRASIPMKVHHV